MASEEKPTSLLPALTEALETGTVPQARAMLNALHPAEMANLLEALPLPQRKVLWELIDPVHDGEVLLHVNEEARSQLIQNMKPEEVIAATEGMAMDDLADFVQDLPATLLGEVLRSMDNQNRHRLETVLSYPEDSAGGLMNTDAVTVRPDVNLDVVLRYLRLRRTLPEPTDSLIVVDRDDRYLGVLPLSRLLTRDPEITVGEVIDGDLRPIPADLSAAEVARLFQDRDLVSAPVVDPEGRVLGRITIDDVVDVIRDEAERSLMSSVGLDEEADMFAPALTSARRRAVWLGVNLGCAFIGAWVIGLFEATIQEIVALAVLMPIVASMAGNAGIQAQTLIIRGLALGQISGGNVRFLLRREATIGLFNGVLWALVVALVATAWFRDYHIGLIIAAAMVLSLLIATVTGVIIPLLLRRLGVDPALAGGMLLTTFTDVIGFLTFLGLATIFLL